MTRKASDLKPWQAVIILVFFLTLLAAIFALQIKKSQHTGASFIHYADRHLNILMGNEILRFRDDGRFSQINLQELGLSDITGGFDFFENGDLLVRSNAPDPGFLDSILVFLRVSGQVTATHPDAILLRCSVANPSISSCYSFQKDISFERTFRSALVGDHLLVADTSRHRLLHFGPQGHLLDMLDEGFRFPNQISVINDTIYVANTNRHGVSYRVINGDVSLGQSKDWQHIDLQQGTATSKEHVFPTEFVKLEKGLAVLSQGPGLKLKLGNIYYFNQEGQLESAFEAPSGADMISVAPYKNGILASDFSNFRIYRFDQQGRYLGDFNAPEYLSAAAERQADRQRYEGYLRVVYMLGAAVFVFFLGIGIWLELARQRHDEKTLIKEQAQFKAVESEQPDFDDPGVEWLAYAKIPLRDNKAIVWLLNSVLILAWLMVLYVSWSMAPMLKGAMILVMTLVTGILIWSIYREKQRKRPRLGVLDNWVFLEDAKGKRSVCHIDQLQYTKTHLIADKVYIHLRQGHYSVFDNEAYRDIIEPRLGRAKPMTQGELWRFLWQQKDLNFIGMLVGVPLIILFMLARLYFES
ncbi:MAG: hypothetical protein C9356_02200 [Oleiphilus sp.]|nr:MAG: hypothetical protein C9356_02200 [Oleiphilus sp.]